MEIKDVNGKLTFDIYTNYANNIWPNGKAKNGTTAAAGDLFLSTTGWSLVGPAPYYSDDYFDFMNGGWNYAVVLGSHGVNSVYDITSGEIVISNIARLGTGIPGDYFKGNQEVLFKPYAGVGAEDSGIWTVKPGVISIDINDALFAYAFSSGKLVFHWTMTCANDVIEGQVPSVPEPSTMLLLGAGLLGLGFLRRR